MAITPFIPPATLSLLPRGNLLLQTQTLNVTWTTLAITVSPNDAADIYGLVTADKLLRTATTAANISQVVAKASAAITYTLSLYVKPSAVPTGNFIALGLQGAASTDRADACFNFVNNTVTLTSTAGGFSNASATITPGAVYDRVTLTATSDASASVKVLVSPSTVSQKVDDTGSANSANPDVWGIQLEPYAQASAYAATTTTADLGIWQGISGTPVFPFLPGQSIALGKSPNWSTGVQIAASGKERRLPYYASPKWAFDLSYEVIRHKPTNEEILTLWEFFNVAQGKNAAWLLVDPSDNYVPSTSADVFGTGDGATTQFQITRNINSFVEPVYGVYQPIILDNGVTTAATLTFQTNGKVTFGTAPVAGHTLSWFGYFYFGCRFDQDDLSLEQLVYTLWAGKTLKLMGQRP